MKNRIEWMSDEDDKEFHKKECKKLLALLKKEKPAGSYRKAIIKRIRDNIRTLHVKC
jgi:hypothetical protein